MPRVVTWQALAFIAGLIVASVIWTWIFRGDIDDMISKKIDALRIEMKRE